ncbi:hypothetical protein [Sorangium sp. So ce176]|uniref:hypothetical protein n=1 Tax=Sorangium sp. So ce176 TaxID=3133286 RepID=UPI003F645E22
MNKIARLALAFAVVTSVSGSAMAMRNDCIYKVTTSTGLRQVSVGYMMAQLEEHLLTSPWDPVCSNHVNWFSGGGGPVGVAQSRMLYSPTFEWGDCYAASYQFTQGYIQVDPQENNYGITAHGQIQPISSFHGTMDPVNGVGVALMKYSPLSSAKQIKMTPECQGP